MAKGAGLWKFKAFLRVIQILMCLCLIVHSKANDVQCGNETKQQIIDRLVAELNTGQWPVLPNNSKTHSISIELYISHFYDISEHDFSFKVNYELLLSWFDARLEFQPFCENTELVDHLFLPLPKADKGICHLFFTR